MIDIKHLHIEYDKTLVEHGSIQLYRGSFTLITGNSGSGKSTLLYRIGLIARDFDYSYSLDGKEIMSCSEEEKANIRKHQFGFVMQDASLYEQYDVLGNMMLYASICNMSYSEEEYQKFLHMVELHVPMHQSICTLSGGERQRLAIACALCKKPNVILLDEPTSALDPKNEEIVFNVLKKLAHEENLYVVVTSHASLALSFADNIYTIKDKAIQCVQGTKIEKDNMQIECVTKKLEKGFYKSYIKYFVSKYKVLNLLICVVITVSLCFSAICAIAVSYYSNHSLEAISEINDLQMFVSTSQKKVDTKLSELSTETVNQLSSLTEVQAAYPYYQLYAMVNGACIPILPYYDENDFSNKILKKTTQQRNSIYVSYHFYQTLNENPTGELSLAMNIIAPENKEMANETKHAYGIFRQDVRSEYCDAEDYIYMQYEDIKDIAKAFAISPSGMTLFAKDVDNYVKLHENIEKMPIKLNASFTDLKTINTLYQNMKWIKSGTILLTVLVCMTLLTLLQINYFYKRNREFSLLVINGLNKKELITLTMLETFVKIAIGFIIFCAFSLLMVIALNGEFKHIIINNMSTLICIGILNIVVIFIIIMLYLSYYLKKLIPENILRS